MRLITGDEVKRAAAAAPLGKASGVDNVPNEVLRRLSDEMYAAYADEFNRILRVETPVPSDWQMGLIKLIPKAGSALSDPSSYRPITLLSHLRKLFELVLWGRLRGYCEERGMPLPMVRALMLLLDGLKSLLLDTAHATAEATDAHCADKTHLRNCSTSRVARHRVVCCRRCCICCSATTSAVMSVCAPTVQRCSRARTATTWCVWGT